MLGSQSPAPNANMKPSTLDLMLYNTYNSNNSQNNRAIIITIMIIMLRMRMVIRMIVMVILKLIPKIVVVRLMTTSRASLPVLSVKGRNLRDRVPAPDLYHALGPADDPGCLESLNPEP